MCQRTIAATARAAEEQESRRTGAATATIPEKVLTLLIMIILYKTLQYSILVYNTISHGIL